MTLYPLQGKFIFEGKKVFSPAGRIMKIIVTGVWNTLPGLSGNDVNIFREA
jgi:hypothetical protein